MKPCYCGSHKLFEACCGLYLNETQSAPTAEALMRSRYSAFATGAVDYLINTTHFSKRKFHNKTELATWSRSNQWLRLEILAVTETTVTFNAYFLDENLKARIHYEHSTFKLENGKWFYVDGEY
jgi:SEC-C motif-containing protein